VAEAAGLPVQGLSLLRLRPEAGSFQPIRVPFQSSHPGWECVGFAPLSDREFLLEWKLSQPDQTRFEYTRFLLSSLSEQRAQRQEYRRACEPLPFERLPAGVRPLAQELLQSLENPGPLPVVFFTVRSAGDPLPRRYVSRSSGSDSGEGRKVLAACAFGEGERWLLLAPDGQLFGAAQAGSSKARRLPALPPGFQYTGLFLSNGLLAAPWEQADFLEEGAAGIFISWGL
jgi:hypothetical protein